LTGPARSRGRGPGAREDPANRIWVVDRVEPPVAVLIGDDDERQVDVPLRRLPAGLRAGAVLRVPVTDAGPLWEAATADEELRRARLQDAEAALARLRRRDPGGDIVL
jgi:hypothetical protein